MAGFAGRSLRVCGLHDVVGGAGIGRQFQHDSWPRRRCLAIGRLVLLTKERSGSRCLVSGVGTQMMMTSQSASPAKSAVARNRPAPIWSARADAANGSDIGMARRQAPRPFRIDVEASDRKAGARHCDRQRQADIA